MSAPTALPPVDPATMMALIQQLEHAIFQVQTYFAALCGIVFYEWLVNLKREIPYIWKADWSMVKVVYLLIRYTGLAHAVIDLYAYFGAWDPETCKQFVAFIPTFPIFGVVLSHLILLVQCHAVWNRNKLVLIILCPLMVTEVIIMAISSFTRIEAVQLPYPTGPCLPRAMSAFCILYFAMPMAFDLAVTILTAIKCFKLRSGDSGIGLGSHLLNTIINQSFQYFIFITAANLTNILYYAIDVNNPSSSLNGPLAIIATELFACRLTLSLRDLKRENGTVTFINTEKKQRHFVKVLVFGNGVHDAHTELETMKGRPVSDSV